MKTFFKIALSCTLFFTSACSESSFGDVEEPENLAIPERNEPIPDDREVNMYELGRVIEDFGGLQSRGMAYTVD